MQTIFLIGVIGGMSDSQKVKEDVRQFLLDNLKLELSEEKTLVTHAKKPAKFFGYDIYVRESDLPKRDKAGRLVRNYGGRIVLAVTMETIRKKLLDHKVVKMVHPNGRYYMKNNDDLEILEQYNAEIRGFYNYYSIANNSSSINSFYYIMEYSMYKTYGTKYRTTVHNIIEKFRLGKEFAVKYRNKKGDEKVRFFYNGGFKRKKDGNYGSSCDFIPNTVAYRSSTILMDRIKANKCELCGSENDMLEMHHVRKLKNLVNKDYWERLMIARQRKTIAVCLDCHTKIHHGK